MSDRWKNVVFSGACKRSSVGTHRQTLHFLRTSRSRIRLSCLVRGSVANLGPHAGARADQRCSTSPPGALEDTEKNSFFPARLAFAIWWRRAIFKRCFLTQANQWKITNRLKLALSVCRSSVKKINFCLDLLGQVSISDLSFISRPYFGILFQQNYNVLKTTKYLKGNWKLLEKRKFNPLNDIPFWYTSSNVFTYDMILIYAIINLVWLFIFLVSLFSFSFLHLFCDSFLV